MKALNNFLIGLIIATVYVLGIGATGFILNEEFALLYHIGIVGIIAVLFLDWAAFCYFPRAMILGVLLPQLAAAAAAGFFYSGDGIADYFTDDLQYRSCVGNPDHARGINDCDYLLAKLEDEGSFTLNKIEGTGGDYWLAEVLSYRGRHLMRDGQSGPGKEDFKRALLLPEGTAVVVNNLAEAGFTREDIFKEEYGDALSKMDDVSFCEVATGGSDPRKAETLDEATKMCQLATGSDAEGCGKIVGAHINKARFNATLLLLKPEDAKVRTDQAQCKKQ